MTEIIHRARKVIRTLML